uniref:Uncharacterized protein n=1 Tax=Streptomyces sp. F12 TaxID=1436084 RepID=V9Z8J7_9ACTN|nr:hypothetical protein pFRL6_356c [Streptomyces sp. F12]
MFAFPAGEVDLPHRLGARSGKAGLLRHGRLSVRWLGWGAGPPERRAAGPAVLGTPLPGGGAARPPAAAAVPRTRRRRGRGPADRRWRR